MGSVEHLLRDLASKVAPTPARADRAKGSHHHLRKLLWEGQFKNRLKTAYLTGSYSRDTAIDPLDDVDMVVVIDPEKWPNRGLIRTIFGGRPDADTVLQSFATAVRLRYDSSSVRVQRRSIRLKLSHINLDIVPAIEDVSPNLIWIPDRETEEWIKSGPVLHRLDGEEVNHRNDGRFKPLVKLLKFWNSRLPKAARLKSFTIETIAARIFRRYRFSSLEDGFFKFLDFIMALDGRNANGAWPDKCGIAFTWEGMQFQMLPTRGPTSPRG